MLKRYGIGLLLVLAVAPSVFIGGAASAQTKVKSSLRKQTSPESSHFKFGFQLGLGSFSSVVLPPNEVIGGESEGSQKATSRHTGVPLGLELAWVVRRAWWQGDLGLAYLNMLNVRQSKEGGQNASGFGRTQLHFAQEAWISRWFAPQLILAGRRSSYKGNSTTHLVDSALVMFGLKSKWRRSRISLYGGKGVYAAYGLSEGSYFASKPLKNAEVEVFALGANYQYRVSKKSIVEFGLDHEVNKVVINDLQSYEEHGLSISPFIPQSRQYDLESSMIRLGLLKFF